MIVRILTTTLAIVSFVSVAGWLSSSTSPMPPGANPANGFTPSIPTACYALPLACELRIELPDQIKRSAVGDYKIQIHNVGAVRVTLVQPGDGSASGRRTPLVGWSLLAVDSEEKHPAIPPARGGGRCGNTNPLQPDELFVLKPGETKNLYQPIDFLRSAAPGKYRVVFYYTNVPDLPAAGIALSQHDRGTLERLRHSTPMALVSNEVQVEIID